MSLSGEQLRAEIDSGKTGDKVGHPDPAAAPLGTDAEAGGSATAFASERRLVKDEKHRGLSGIALFLGLGFAVDFCILVSVLLGAT
jgi:hypothetical protein